jgi:hypothetical protein
MLTYLMKYKINSHEHQLLHFIINISECKEMINFFLLVDNFFLLIYKLHLGNNLNYIGLFWYYNLLYESSILTPAPSKRDRRGSQQIQRSWQKITAIHAIKNQSLRTVEWKFTRSQWDRVSTRRYLSKELDAKIYKQVGGVLIDQKKKEVKTTLSNRVALIKNQIEHTNELLKKN